MNSLKLLIVIILLHCFFFIYLHANLNVTPNSDIDNFKEAILAYQNNNWIKALDYFLLTEKSGLKNPSLYFNIGNAYYRNNDIANAIVYYKKALLLDSSFNPARKNLDFMLSITQDKQVDLEENNLSLFLVRIFYFFSINSLFILSFIMLFIVIVLVHLQWFFSENDNTIIKFLTLIFIFVFLGFSSLTWSRSYLVKNNNEAVIMESTVYVYSGPSEDFTRLFTIREGTVLKIHKEERNWTQITTLSGYSGWITSDTFKKIAY